MSTSKKEIYSELAAFIEANQQQLYRMAYSYVACKETALDMVQDSVYKALKGYRSIGDLEEIRPWVYRILINICIDELRKRRRSVATAPEDMPVQSQPGPEQRVEMMDMQEVLDDLDPETRTIIMLRYFEDMKIKEIAALLQINVNSVKSRLYRGIEQMKTKMDVEDRADGQ